MGYPIVIIPDTLKKAKEKFPSLPHEPAKPVKPETTLKGCTLWLVLSAFLFFTLMMNLGGNGSSNDETLLINFFGLICLVPLFIWLIKNKNKNKNKKNAFEKELQLFPERIVEHKKRVEEILSPENLKRYRAQELHRLLSQTGTVGLLDRVVNQGKYEQHFLGFLNRYFPGKIITSVSLGYFNNPYAPDFAFIDKESDLHIDIEIDEPYILHSKKPIHYIGSDKRRNLYFESQKWVVIRFAEEQVAKHPESCCKVIAQTIYEIIGDSRYIQSLNKFNYLEKVSHWTYEDSLNLASQNYRDTY